MNPLNSYEEKKEWIELTLLELECGDADPARCDALRELLLRDREARQIYLRYNQIDSMLEMSNGVIKNLVPVPPLGKVAQFCRNNMYGALIGAGIAATVALMIWPAKVDQSPTSPTDSNRTETQAVASLRSDYGAVIGGKSTMGENELGEGPLSLERGIAQLVFRNGAQIVLEGKCGFEIIDGRTVVLNNGKMWVHCPLEARGFRVLTPSGREIIDLGTEFGVEIDEDGQTAVHVFDGLVDVVVPGTKTQRIRAGAAYHWTAKTVSGSRGKADAKRFVTATALANKRWMNYQSKMRKREDLLLYYDFSDISDVKNDLITNHASAVGKRADARILRTTLVSGRVSGAKALQFENPGDGLALDLPTPENVQGLTVAMWLKVDRFDSRLSTLINSNGWDPGDLHFQVTNDGNLRAAINGGIGVDSPSGTVVPGKWHLVAVSWDFVTKETRLFRDGESLTLVSSDPKSTPSDSINPSFGSCQIASWEDVPAGSIHVERDLKGRIDEVMIFDHALSDEEMRILFAAGQP